MRTRSRVPYQRPDTSSAAGEPDTEVQMPIAVQTTYASSHGRAQRSRGSSQAEGRGEQAGDHRQHRDLHRRHLQHQGAATRGGVAERDVALQVGHPVGPGLPELAAQQRWRAPALAAGAEQRDRERHEGDDAW